MSLDTANKPAPAKPRRPRRARGSGSVFRQKPNGPWWISYKGPDGKRKQESSGTTLKSVAVALLQSRIGARLHNLPVILKAVEFPGFSGHLAFGF